MINNDLLKLKENLRIIFSSFQNENQKGVFI